MRSLLHKFDSHLTEAIQAWPKTVRGTMKFITLLGGPLFTVGIGALITGVGLGRANEKLLWVGILVLVTLAAGAFLKIVLRRKRPLTEYVFHMRFPTFSFPSGHSVGGIIVYGALAVLAWYYLPIIAGIAATALLGIIIVAIGVSRVYLGAHFPSDVIAGWVLGAVGLSGVLLIMGMH